MPRPTITNTFSANTQIKSAQVNQNFTDVRTFSGVRLYKSVDELYATGAYRDLLFDTEDFDTDSYHSTASNTQRITCAVAGYYLFSAVIQFAVNTTGIRVMRFNRYNSSSVSQATYHKQSIGANTGGGANTYLSSSGIIKMNADDFVIVEIYQDSGGNLNLIGGNEACSASCEFLGV